MDIAMINTVHLTFLEYARYRTDVFGPTSARIDALRPLKQLFDDNKSSMPLIIHGICAAAKAPATAVPPFRRLPARCHSPPSLPVRCSPPFPSMLFAFRRHRRLRRRLFRRRASRCSVLQSFCVDESGRSRDFHSGNEMILMDRAERRTEPSVRRHSRLSVNRPRPVEGSMSTVNSHRWSKHARGPVLPPCGRQASSRCAALLEKKWWVVTTVISAACNVHRDTRRNWSVSRKAHRFTVGNGKWRGQLHSIASIRRNFRYRLKGKKDIS